MSGTRRTMVPALLVLGGAALATSFVAARHWQDANPGALPAKPAPALPIPAARCLGVVDVEGGLVPLAPAQAGEYIAVNVTDGQAVKAGEELLKLDDTLFHELKAEAQGALNEARAKLDEAEHGLYAYVDLLSGQTDKIAAHRHELEGAQIQLSRLDRMKDSGNTTIYNSDDHRTAMAKLEGAKSSLRAEESRLRSLQKMQPDPQVAQARAAVQRLESKKKQAEYAIKKCVVTAPADGTVVQVFASVGSGFNPQSARTPALFFWPKASKLIVRADVEQFQAAGVSVGQKAAIQDEAVPKLAWSGAVKWISASYLPRRVGATAIPNPMQMAEPRVLECVILIDENEKAPPRIGQRVRVQFAAK